MAEKKKVKDSKPAKKIDDNTVKYNGKLWQYKEEFNNLVLLRREGEVIVTDRHTIGLK